MRNMPKLMRNQSINIFKPLFLLGIAAFFLIVVLFRFTPDQSNAKLSLACPLPSKNEEIIVRKAYTLAYNELHEQANWVAYTLLGSQLNGGVERSNRFMEDPLVSTGSATNADYAKSGYDRGHLAPAADMSWSTEVMQSSFYYSNMSPQLPSFNRGIWKRLEEKVREWAARYDTLYVVTGPLLSAGLSTIGPNKVSVPKYYYKALIAPHQKKGIAFLLPNEKSEEPLANFMLSIDALENKMGRDLFYQFPDDLEHLLETQQIYWP